MESNNNNSKMKISKRKMIFIAVLMVLSTITIILVITNLFTENPFQKKYITAFMVMIFGIIGFTRFYGRYRKSKNNF